MICGSSILRAKSGRGKAEAILLALLRAGQAGRLEHTERREQQQHRIRPEGVLDRSLGSIRTGISGSTEGLATTRLDSMGY